MEEGACNYEAEGLTSQALPQLSRTLLHGGTFTHAIKGCFRTAGRLEVLLGRDSSLQLALGDLSVFEAIQPVFAPIRDLQTYVWRDSPGLQCLPKVEWGKDLVLLLTASGNLAVLQYNSYLGRFANLLDCKISDAESRPTRHELANWSMLSVYPTSPCVAAASALQISVFLLDLRRWSKPSRNNPLSRPDACVVKIATPHGSLVASVCLLPDRAEDRLCPRPLVAALTHPFASLHLPSIVIYECTFDTDGSENGNNRGHYTQITKLEALFSPAEGWPLSLSAIPPSQDPAVQGIVILREQGITVLSLQQLLAARKFDVAAQTAIGLPLPVACAWVDNGPAPSLLLSGSTESNTGSVILLTFAAGLGCFGDWCHKLSWGPLNELSLPHAATCMLGLPDASLLLCVENGCPLKLTPQPSGVGLAQMLQSNSSSAIADLMANSKRHQHLSKAAVITRVDWGGCPLRDFVVVKNQGIDEVVGISGQADTGALCFLEASRQAPLELEGPREDSAVTGIWAIKQRPSDLWHALMLVSFSTASRAVTAGLMLRDVSEVVGICEDEHTLACCEVAEATMVQVTPSQVLCCGLHALHDESESESESGASIKRRSSLVATFSGLAMSSSGGTEHPGRGSEDRSADAVMDTGSSVPPHEHAVHSWGASPSGRAPAMHTPGEVWRPPAGATISAAGCTQGLVLVFHGAGADARLVALRYQNVASPVKRKRDSRSGWGLVECGGTALDAEPSCLDVQRSQKGGYVAAICMHGPSLELLHVSHQHSSATLDFARICRFDSSGLSACVASTGLSASAVLGSEPAESLHFLPNQSLVEEQQTAEELTAVFHILASWRSGHLLHFRLNADGLPQQAAPSHPQVQDPEQLFSSHLMDAIRLGSAPAGVQPLPATDRKCFLAVGMRAAVVEYDSTRARLEMQWLALPGVRHAAPMYTPGYGSRRKQMLLCAAEGNRLQLRRFTNEPGAANPAAVAMRPLGATPLALTRHCKTDSVAVLLDDNSLKILSDRGRGKGFRMRLPAHEQATCLTTWTPKSAMWHADDYRGGHQERPKETSSDDEGDGKQDYKGRQQKEDAPNPLQRTGSDPASTGSGSQSQDGDTLALGESMRDWADQQIRNAELTREVSRLAKLELASPNREEVLKDEFLVVGSARMAEELDDWRLESLSDERDRCQQVHGRLLVLRVRSRQDGSCAASLFYQLAFPGPLHAVGTSSAALESVVVASMGPRLLTLRLGDYPGEPLVVYGNARTDRAVSCISALPDCLGAAVGDQEHGAALWLYNQSPYEQLEDPTQYLMGSQVRRPVTSCLSLLQLSDTVMPAPRQSAGLLMAADAAGSVTTVGRSSEELRQFCREDLGFDCFQSSCTYDDLIAESQPERAAANLGAPLLKLQKGSWETTKQSSPAGGEDQKAVQEQPCFLVSSSVGQLFQVADIDHAAAVKLRHLEAVLAKHPATAPLAGDDHRLVRRGNVPVPDGSVIIDGDMLAQFLHLPLLIQWAIAEQWGKRAGERLQPTAIASMLKDEYGLGVG